MTQRINAIFRAGFVRRWHANPDLCHTVDPIDAHSGRCARLLLALWPNSSPALIQYMLTHDDGESVVGDHPPTHKRPHETTDEEDRARLALWPFPANLSDIEKSRAKFCDRLDAFMWVKHHAPHALSGDGWPEALIWLRGWSEALGVDRETEEILK